MAKTVVVLGGAYGGARAAQLIAAGLPQGWRIVLLDRNSHVNHVYIFPRLATLPGHEHKAFIPFDNIFQLPSDSKVDASFMQARVLSLDAHSVTFSRAGTDTEETLPFDYAVYALGSHLPAPLNPWDPTAEEKILRPYRGTKAEGIAWLKHKQQLIEDSESVLVVGGGALGIQFATDIAAIYPGKPVTLLHSRHRLLPRFDPALHTEIIEALDRASVSVILGERLDLSSLASSSNSTVRTQTGREISAGLVLLCTGQTPNTSLLSAMDAQCVDEKTGLARVLRTMQLAVGAKEEEDLSGSLEKLVLHGGDVFEDEDDMDTTPYPHIFVVGDAADAFGAIPAGHNAYHQATVAAGNVLRLINTSSSSSSSDSELEPLECYTPSPPAIKVTLGLTKNVYEVGGVVGVGVETREDLNAASIWPYFGFPDVGEEGVGMFA
ncbi:hypothetical protein FB45DRAFT_1052428 [Roridomyces roridus]|uniref:FAD/NAD(P)-binding domain-containing protein n=1 Tax=Roridomyces roridus TaxID=1738132 RepID=A0AAD7CGW7_9AGAR|nr:hypothetical protein FB45DRAFT_1052428 [Roridomyces roridus]